MISDNFVSYKLLDPWGHCFSDSVTVSLGVLLSIFCCRPNFAWSMLIILCMPFYPISRMLRLTFLINIKPNGQNIGLFHDTFAISKQLAQASRREGFFVIGKFRLRVQLLLYLAVVLGFVRLLQGLQMVSRLGLQLNQFGRQIQPQGFTFVLQYLSARRALSLLTLVTERGCYVTTMLSGVV